MSKNKPAKKETSTSTVPDVVKETPKDYLATIDHVAPIITENPIEVHTEVHTEVTDSWVNTSAGKLEIVLEDGTHIKANAGDVISLPKGTHVAFDIPLKKL